jgi:hypothetical protein
VPIEDRDLKAGTRLVAQYKGQDRSCEVVQTDDGLRYRLDDGTEYKSPSSAGKAVTGGVAVNGWKFWSVAGAPWVEAKKAKAAAKKEKGAVKPTAKKSKGTKKSAKAKRPKAQRAASGESYGCGVCGESFATMKAATAHAQEAHLS